MYGVACSLILINDAASSFIRIHVQRWGLGTVHWITRRKTKEENWSCIPASLPSGRSCWFSRCSTTWTLLTEKMKMWMETKHRKTGWSKSKPALDLWVGKLFPKISSELREKAFIPGKVQECNCWLSCERRARNQHSSADFAQQEWHDCLYAVAFLSIKPLEAFGFVSKNYWLG